MGVTAVNNIPDIVIKPKSDVAVSTGKNAGKPPVQPAVQEATGNKGQEKFSEEAIKRMIDQANRSLAEHHTQLSFSIHERTREVVVKVLDTDSGEVLKEIPAEKTLDRLAAVLEDIGWIIDRKV